MWAAEFGQDTWDELNIITPGGNYGWPVVEGIGGDGRFVDPVQQWPTDDASPSGLAVVGDTIYIAALRGERLIAVSAADPSVTADFFVGEYGRLRDVVPAPDGSLWMLTNNTDGRGDSARRRRPDPAGGAAARSERPVQEAVRAALAAIRACTSGRRSGGTVVGGWRRGRQILQQVPGDVGDLGDRPLERLAVGVGQLGDAADLADVLPGCRLDLDGAWRPVPGRAVR